MSGALEPTLRAALTRAAEPVAREARDLISEFPGAKTSTIGPRVVMNGVYVTQRARKVTGARPDFGALQMVEGMIPALEHNEENIMQGAEGAIEALARLGGF